MNNIDKVILLAEYFGLDVSDFKNSYHAAINEGETMKRLDYNISKAGRYENDRVHALIEEYTKLLEIRPKTFEEEIIFNAKVNYLCSVSYEQFYLNPFEIGTVETQTRSIGELMLPFDGRYVSINDIIMDSSHSFKYKSEAVRRQVNIYHKEMSAILHEPIEQIKKSKRADEGTVKHSRFPNFFLAVAFVIMNIYLFSLLLFQGEVYQKAKVLDFSNVFFYAFYLPFIATALFDITFVLSDCFRKKDQESYYFAKRYLDFGTKHVFSNLATAALRLNSYIMDAARVHVPLVDDITKFSKVGGDELDLYGLMAVKSNRDRLYVRLFKTLRNIFFTVSVVTIVFSATMFMLYHFGLLGNLL